MNTLNYLRQQLEDKFWNTRILDPKEWDGLAEQFRDNDRPSGADAIIQKFYAYSQLNEPETVEA